MSLFRKHNQKKVQNTHLHRLKEMVNWKQQFMYQGVSFGTSTHLYVIIISMVLWCVPFCFVFFVCLLMRDVLTELTDSPVHKNVLLGRSRLVPENFHIHANECRDQHFTI